eukprot:TRINITY_DN17986_c0_g1_i2.p1 TRINITY_DN17986_c0_g1~~TRINITY_DN17986_c0_g1_i2.p1  ORF type:complete len:109 (-),score=22.95 TRINITY_DN17986_c0_g1_i2:7-333(-)
MNNSIFEVSWIKSLIKEDKQSILMDSLNIDQASDKFLQIINQANKQQENQDQQFDKHENLEKYYMLSLIHISEPTRLGMISYAVFCLKKKKKNIKKKIQSQILTKQHQ